MANLCFVLIAALFITSQALTITGPVIEGDFPDPAVLSFDESYIAFATNSGGKHVPSAKSGPDGKWSRNDEDTLPIVGAWATGQDVWAPDIVRLDNGTFIMYYSARLKSNSRFHCVGTATSNTVTGPYEAANEPFTCPIDQGGAIDPKGYQDPATGLRYVLYKVDGSRIGTGGDCGNAEEPIQPTPIKLQQVGSDGETPVGEPVTILDRDDSDGPLIEAPSLYRSEEGIYFLFFSSNCFTSSDYDVKYATATNIMGPYIKASAPLLKSGDGPNLNGPGGADVSNDGKLMAFHANTNPQGAPLKRELFTARPTFSGRVVTL